MNNNVEKTFSDLLKWFFWFWVARYKVSFLLIFLIVFSWLFSLYSIPKESSPDIEFGIIWITTSYVWVNPNDIDSLITEKIENEIKNIDGIKKITSTSSVWVSSVNVELNNDANTRDVLTDIKDSVDKVDLPADAEDPIIIELSTSNELMYEVLMYGSEDRYSQFEMNQKAQLLKSQLEWQAGIDSIDVWGADLQWFWGAWGWANEYEIKVLLDRQKVELLGLSVRQVAQKIESYNKNTPIGNYKIGDLKYDFRFDWELSNQTDLANIVLKWENGSFVYLKDVAQITNEYKTDEIKKLGFENNIWYNYVALAFNKSDGSNIFQVSKSSKIALEEYLKDNKNFEWIDIFFTKDLWELIIEDYATLWNTAIQTLLLVFVTILIFVGLRESIIASLLIPLSFLVTFLVLNMMGLSLNFLTNFSLVLTLWIAIDTVIVIIEAASEKLKLWYNKRSAVLLAVKEFKAPLIAGTLTTLVAFLPLMFLPGVMGKFLWYIPTTVFSTLVAALFLSLTISSTLFIKLVKNGKTYHKEKKLEETFSQEQKEFLEYQRRWKIEIHHDKMTKREKVLSNMWSKYYDLLEKVISSAKSRFIAIVSPIIFLILTFIFLAPNIWFILFPATDEWVINMTIETRQWASEDSLEKFIPIIDQVISVHPELKVYNNTISGNTISTYIELTNSVTRQALGQKSAFEIEEIISKWLSQLESYGLSVSVKTQAGWPPSGKPVGIKLIANNSDKIDELKNVSLDFKRFLSTTQWAKNVTTSSSESPGQFIFQFDKNKLYQFGLVPDDILGELYFYTNGVKAGSIKSEFEDNDIVVKIKEFDENLSPDDIKNIIINTSAWEIRVWDVADFNFVKAVSAITRENNKITISVESDILPEYVPTDIQPILVDFAEKYSFPAWISFAAWGENQENMDLIISTFVSLFIALFLIFSILVFQFNSFRQPAIVLYSVILALLWVNIGLFLTGNPYSMPFMIWFIALTWVVVNDAIILIDRMNKNVDKWIDWLHAVVSAWKSRLQPIIVTTLTTVFWVLPLALQDEFWAWLWFTIVFGLFAGSSMTLFVIPSLYYQTVILRENKYTPPFFQMVKKLVKNNLYYKIFFIVILFIFAFAIILKVIPLIFVDILLFVIITKIFIKKNISLIPQKQED